ncbi:hypothetical protein Kisp01_58060 [Kineosporia sp. NBRC 101677]|uniref:hypothetical protein n=1 Tax=Kineosporia sp. NBRC 101677 TaxID=3032197 RepID=UPI0024A1EFA9|nr:hypothetical protein [Kineosporia sp. NBRC 101677]GLY18792.1 hypothetical protein Kisp01_58060 [Kineosporia sp. NBRC 101677]
MTRPVDPDEQEYVEFGPWVTEVRTFEEIPRLFRSAGIDPREQRLVLKVPRDIERRNVGPGMHLYDYLVVLGFAELTVLQRSGERFQTRSIPIDQIAAVQDSVRLLDGRLTVHALDGSNVQVAYNGSATDTVRKLVDQIRETYAPRPQAMTAVPQQAIPALGRGDVGLATEVRRLMQAEPQLRVLHAAPGVTVTPASAVERFYRRLQPLTLHPLVALQDEREIQVIHRRDWCTPAGDEISLARTLVPRSRITQVMGRPWERFRGVHVITVHVGQTQLDFPVQAGPQSTAILAGIRP